MDRFKQNWPAWLALFLALGAYAVATAGTIASQGQRITALEAQAQQSQQDRQVIKKELETIGRELAGMRSEQAVLHGRPADWRIGER